MIIAVLALSPRPAVAALPDFSLPPGTTLDGDATGEAAPDFGSSPLSSPSPDLSMPEAASPDDGDHRIAAVVGDDIITRLELDERMRLAIATTGLPNVPDVQRQLLPRILQNLVDESLQQQELKKSSILVTPQDVDEGIAGLEQGRGRPAGSLTAFLKARGVPERTFRKQLETQIGWSRLVGQKIRKQVRVSDEEIDAESARRTSPTAKKEEVLLASLVLPVESPEAEATTKELGERLMQAIKQGASFDALTTQLSSGQATAIGATWVDIGALEPKVAEDVDATKPPGYVGPVRTPSGYQILQVKEKRETSLFKPDAEVAMKAIRLSLDESAETREVDLLMKIARDVAKAPGSCTEKGVAGIEGLQGLNIEVKPMRAKLSALPEQLQTLVEPLAVGHMTDPFATPQGIQMLMLCEKTELPFPAPDKEKIRLQIFRQKLELEAQKFMRNLRRSSYIDVRVRKGDA